MLQCSNKIFDSDQSSIWLSATQIVENPGKRNYRGEKVQEININKKLVESINKFFSRSGRDKKN